MKYADLCHCAVCTVAQKYQDAGVDNQIINGFMELAAKRALDPFRKQIESANAIILEEVLSEHVIAMRAANDMLSKGMLTMRECVETAAGPTDEKKVFWDRVMQHAKTMKAN